MTTKIIKIIPMEENTEIHIAEIRDGYSVGIHDVDSGSMCPNLKIFKTLVEAETYAEQNAK